MVPGHGRRGQGCFPCSRFERLGRKDALNPERLGATRKAMVPTQQPTHLPKQRIVRGRRQVRHPHLGRVAPPARPANCQDRHAPLPAARDQPRLPRRAVDRVHQHLKTRGQQPLRVVGTKRLPNHRHPTIRVDGSNPLGQHLRLQPTQVQVQRRQLTVEVRELNHVRIHQRQAPHARSGQGLHGPRTHPSQPHHRHMGGPQPSQPLRRQQPAHPAEAFVVVAHASEASSSRNAARGSGAATMGRPITSQSAPAAIASRGVNVRF